ncbi:hypothetical protein EMCG_03980 [[Emmonsia] crescens]|uniref:Uncharacterized protein n=1 Tax=[Emmonsia] crescens TaxID=73230 RepID=A0A0G2IZE2_9EURO|nr:hypothetical protein EMCG_03980 [Emmonsia crescens UAMH 3008]
MLTFGETTGLLILVLVFLQPLVLPWVRRFCPWLWPQQDSAAVLREIRNEVNQIRPKVDQIEVAVTQLEQSTNSALPNIQSSVSSLVAAAAVAPHGSQSAQA